MKRINKFPRSLLFLFLFPFLNTTFDLGASELDSWTGRKNLLNHHSAKALKILNTKINLILQQAINIANDQGSSCELKALYDAVKREFVGNFLNALTTGNVDEYVRTTPDLEGLRVCTSLDDSVFRDFPFRSAPVLKAFKMSMGCGININGNIIGDDKLAHFFGNGFSYFRLHFLENWPLKEILKYGEYTEKTFYGLQTTGIYSYGDLAANYEGFKFWSELTEAFSSPVSSSVFSRRPYVICANGLWKANPQRKMNLSEIINEAMDEGKNPNRYAHPERMETQVQVHIHDQGWDLPLTKADCEAIRKRYGHQPEVLRSLLSPQCAAILLDRFLAEELSYDREKSTQFFDQKECEQRDIKGYSCSILTVAKEIIGKDFIWTDIPIRTQVARRKIKEGQKRK